MDDYNNYWKFSGEIFYLREQQGEFGASMKLRGIAQRKDAQSTQITEITCLMLKPLYDELLKQGYKVYSKICLSGHIESWIKNDKMKVMLIADNIE